MTDVESIPAGTLGNLVLFRRNAAGMTQEDLADCTGLSVRTIRDIERGRTVTPSLASVRLLMKALGPSTASGENLFALVAASRLKASAMTASPGADPTGAPSPSQTPADVGDFTGRDAEAAAVARMLAAQVSGQRGRAGIAAVVGMPGIGKTALAVRVAHQVAGYFPDGQLYANVRGSDHACDVRGVALRFIHALGAAAPAAHRDDPDECIGRYQSLLAGKRVLIFLDDVHDAAQVQQLIPSAARCGILITSRNRLPDLEGTSPLTLAPLAPGDDRALLARITGADRMAAEPAAADAVLTACAGLPLAIRIAGARLASRPRWKIATLAERLANPARILCELQLGGLSVASSLRRSYDDLMLSGDVGRGARAVFQVLGRQGMTGFTAADVAAATGQETAAAETFLEFLVDFSLLDGAAPGWYRMHNLIQLFSRAYCQGNGLAFPQVFRGLRRRLAAAAN